MIEQTGPVDIDALQRPQAWPHETGTIELRETHISWVFLTGDYAYKIKKPVDFGFLDFSTLEKRRHFCEEEVRLNRRLAPDIYLDVVALSGDPQAPVVGGEGPALDYAVRMRQFDSGLEFDAMLERGELTAELMDLTAKTLADFHAAIDCAAPETAFGTAEAVYQPVLENFDNIHRSLESLLQDRPLMEEIAALEQWSRHSYHQLQQEFRQRKLGGFIRECHGDLHLRNIIHWRGEVIPFDCLEFDPNLRWIDVMSEIAFLLMDLDDHQRPDLGRRLLNTYLEYTGDFAGLRVLRYYQVYRALVRAKVAGLRLLQLSEPAAVRGEMEEVRNYIGLATRYTRPSQTRLVITHGLSASGKSRLSRRLLEGSDLIRVRSDVERKRLFGLDAVARSESASSLGIYSPDATSRTYARLQELAQGLIDSGHAVLVDATFLSRAHRKAFADCAGRAGIPFTILHCTAPAAMLRQRVLARSGRSGEVSEANLAVLERQLESLEALDNEELDHCIRVDTSGQPDLADILSQLDG